MDTVTHLVAGALTPLAFKNAPKTRALTVFGIICGEFPDIDAFAGRTAESILAFHRGITHSIFVQPLSALILALIFHRMLKKGDESGTWTFAKTWGVGLLALYIHLFLDCMTTFGTQIFLPVSSHRVALPAIYIIDLAMTLPLLAAWICILRRGGSKAPVEKRAPVARRALAWLIAYPLLALCFNYTAAHSLEKRYAAPGNERSIVRVELSPEPFAPFNWKAVAVAHDKYYMARFFTPEWGRELTFTPYERPTPDFVAGLRRAIPLFAMYDDFATYIFMTTENMADGNDLFHVLSFKDVRYEATLPRLMDAVGRTDGLFIMQVKMTEYGAIAAYRFLHRGREAATTPWEIARNAGNAG